MRSRAVRLSATAAALLAAGVASFFLINTEKQIAGQRESVREFDLHAREASDAFADMRAAQLAYVAAGQGVTFWVPKVEALQNEMARWLDSLRASAQSTQARSALMEASAKLNEFATLDRQARDYIRSGETLMASDVVFTASRETSETAARLVETARQAEHQTFASTESGLRRQQAASLGGAGVFSVVVMFVLALVSPGAQAGGSVSDNTTASTVRPTGELMLRDAAPPPGTRVPSSQPRGSVPLLKAAAELCTEFGRVTDPSDLPGLLARAADMMDASGVVVWLGDRTGADLRPVLAHGYPEHVLARMPKVPRSADNAAATAYRTGKLQIVLRRPGGANGAVVAPLLSSDGCVGALTAEILAGSEATDSVQALAAIIAAQLTGVLVPTAVASANSFATDAGKMASA
jgi:hypothetical protein